jgi:hypothetical protein
MDDALVRYALKKLPGETDDQQRAPARSGAGQRSQMIVADDINAGPEGFKGNKSLGHFLLEPSVTT